MATDWNNLRPWNGSREKGFEELCCQVAAGEAYPVGSKFIRKGTPDAGVECYWALPSGDEHAWQAKFFTSPLTPGQWGQIDDSIKTAIAKHGRLTRYTVCLPIDLPDARQKGQKSLQDKWNDRVVIWKEWAAKRRMEVEFEFWGDHQLTSRINREENRGRHWFWFTHEQFTLEWFRKKLAIAIENAGERYTPVLHVDLPIARYFSALGRTPAFHCAVNTLYQRIRETAGRFDHTRLPSEIDDVSKEARVTVKALSNLFDAFLLPIADPATVASPDPIGWQDLKRIALPLHDQLIQICSTLWAQVSERQQEQRQEPPDKWRSLIRELEEAQYYCRALQDVVSDLLDFCDGAEANVANRPALLLVGEAGQGKTHLLCDVAEKDLQENRPRILLHGAHFTDGEPWSQIVQLLQLNCSTDEFVGALEAAARAYKCRIILLVDALNEGQGRVLWAKHLAGMLAALASNEWVGIAVSVRSSYEDLVIPDSLVPERLTRVVHQGFDEHEYEAVNRFFVHYGIQPTAPLLVPEFTNPLFLKLFCQGVKENGWKQVPLGLRGITAILHMFLDAINKKLSKPDKMDYDRARNPVRKATDGLVRLMLKSGEYWLPREEVLQALNLIHKVEGHDQSLFRNLVSEGVLAENRWKTKDGHIEVVSFAYERFADHLLAKHLLDTSLDPKVPKKSFGPRTRLGKILKAEGVSWRHAGLIEALSIQLPERISKELFELAPHAANFDVVQRGFVKSLVWRDSAAFTDSTFKQMKDLSRYKDPREEILNTLLTVAPVPDHPLNADKLHEILSKETMAARDAWWSVFLHWELQSQRAVSRLIDWTWGESDKSSLPEPVVLLTGTALAWFLTSSNRFLRDRATKALVRLFENKLTALRGLLARFWTVNDPYVLERLLAAAYGCAMRSQDMSGLDELAADVSNHLFGEAAVLPQVLTRDYARGIIECARERSGVPSDAFLESRPPYNSKWPNMKVPSAKTLEKWGEWRENMPDRDVAQCQIYSSINGRGISDFSKYVIGDLTEWTSVRLGTDPPRTLKEEFDEFVTRLRPAQLKALERFRIVSDNAASFRRWSPEERLQRFGFRVTDEQLDGLLADSEKKVLETLKKDSALRSVFETTAKSYIQEPSQFQMPHVFDENLARRWMIQRIIDFGWTIERFGEFDRMVNRWRDTGQTAHKAERIGKKYQWIAYRELLARLSDNFYMRKDRYSNEGLKVYTGPWEAGFSSARDIDPSVVVRNTPQVQDKAGGSWWSPVVYSGWHANGVDVDWLRTTDDLPPVEPLLSVRSVDGTSEWYVLNTYVEWKQPPRPGRDAYEEPRQRLWYMVRSYLVRGADATAFFRWAKQQDFTNERMAEPRDVNDVFLGECFWAPAYRENIGECKAGGWTRGWFDRVPTEILVTSLQFAHASSGFDCSVDDSFRIKLPAQSIVSGMNLRWSGLEGRYTDPTGRVTAYDPSVFEPGPGALLVRQDALREYLADNGLELFWTVLGEKQIIGGWSSNKHGWLQVSGVYRLTAKGIVGQSTPEYRLTARRSRRARKRT